MPPPGFNFMLGMLIGSLSVSCAEHAVNHRSTWGDLASGLLGLTLIRRTSGFGPWIRPELRVWIAGNLWKQ